MYEGKERESLIQELRILRDKLSQYDSQNKTDTNRYEIMAEDAPLIIFAHREKFIYVNKTAALFSGYTKEELYKMNFWDIAHPEFKDIVKARGFKHLNGERVPTYYEIKIVKKNREECWLACGIKHVDDFRGAPAVIASAIDITEKKKAEKELKTQKNYFKSLFDNSPSAIALLDKEDNIVQINKSFHELFKYSFEEVKGKKIKDLISPEGSKEEVSFSQQLLRGEILKPDTVMLSKDGTLIDVNVSGGPIIEDNNIIGVFALYDDIRKRKTVEKELKNSFRKLTEILAGTVAALSETIGKRDPFTAGHQRRVSQLAVAIGEKKNFSGDQLKILEIASALHDIGKIHVPAEILNKPVELSEYEMALVRNHTQVGYDILKSVDFPGPVAKIVFQHHERINGSGYPLGIKGKDIIMESRILAVADVVEAMSSRRPYREAFSIGVTLSKITEHRGNLFDPEVVDICVDLFEKGFEFNKVGLFEEELWGKYEL
ncbi:PAS domain S-box protein [candidate division WOR-3 bacterium]|nr:PAS domain S-box protein [candidate division WOR-3 bacterium]